MSVSVDARAYLQSLEFAKRQIAQTTIMNWLSVIAQMDCIMVLINQDLIPRNFGLEGEDTVGEGIHVHGRGGLLQPYM